MLVSYLWMISVFNIYDWEATPTKLKFWIINSNKKMLDEKKGEKNKWKKKKVKKNNDISHKIGTSKNTKWNKTKSKIK